VALAVLFSEDLRVNVPSAAQWTCRVAGVIRGVTVLDAGATANENAVRFTLASAVTAGQVVTIEYRATGAVKVMDENNVKAQPFGPSAVTNATP
jgi:hypothetical protein